MKLLIPSGIPNMNRCAACLVWIALTVALPAYAQAPASAAAPAAQAPAKVTLPRDIKWETNNDDPALGSPKAIRGGTFHTSLRAYPLTLRVMGPNSNDVFANWNRPFSLDFQLVRMHPVTDRFIPMLATHWAVQPGGQTIYFKLDPDARWSDGHKITADDYVFTWKMMQSEVIVDPFMNSYAKEYFKSVDKIDDYTLRIVGTRPSWRPLYDYDLFPMPAHATKLDKDWVTRTTNTPPIVAGPYVISSVVRGQSVTFTRVPNWWGDKKRYFQGQYNVDSIVVQIMAPERVIDYLRLGQIDVVEEGSPKTWNENYNFPAVTNGWIHRVQTFTETPEGVGGIIMNTQAPIFQNRNFRIAMGYLYDFDRLNRNVLYNSYSRLNSFFSGTEFANPDVKAYPFDPGKAREYLARAGYHRPADLHKGTLWGKIKNTFYGLLFTRSDTDDILVNEKGEKASFTLIYSSKSSEATLILVQQDFRRAGVDMRLQLLEGGTMFQRALERKFEATSFGMTSSFYPDPRQYLHSIFQKTVNNNAFFGFASKEVDGLIEVYEKSPDAKARLDAMYRIDQIVHDQALYVPTGSVPYNRIAYWDYVVFPDYYLPKRAANVIEAQYFWIDPARKAALTEAMRTGKAYPVEQDINKDYYELRKKLQ